MPAYRQQCAYLVARELREGDVVLTSAAKLSRETNWCVQAIRPMTWSIYTHASVMMTWLGMLEAKGPGCTSQISIYSLFLDGGDLRIDVGSPRALVLRPTTAGFERAGGEAAFRKKISSSVLAYLGREYSHEVDLVNATWLSFTRRFLQKTEPSLLRRWSCSGLVAETYLDAGLDVVNGHVRRAAPGTFARSQFMCAVPTAVRALCAEPSRWPYAPLSEITGDLSVQNIELKVKHAKCVANESGSNAAENRLDQDLTAMLMAPVNRLNQQYQFEAKLVCQGLL